MISSLKKYFAYTYWHLKAIRKRKTGPNLLFENMDELRETNIVGYKTSSGLKKLTTSYVDTRAVQHKFVLNHLYKKQVIYDDGSNIIKIPLEPAHLLNLKFKKDQQLHAYVKAGIKIFYDEDQNLTQAFFVTSENETFQLIYIHSLQNYCRLIKNEELDFSMVL